MTLEEQMDAAKAKLIADGLKALERRHQRHIEQGWVEPDKDDYVPSRPSKETYYRMTDWKNLRDYHIEQHPTCPFCGEPATDVHHILKFYHQPTEQLRLAVMLDEENLLSVCQKHHKRLHSSHREDYFRPDYLEAIDKRKNYIVKKHQGALWETDDSRHPIYTKEYMEYADKLNNKNNIQ